MTRWSKASPAHVPGSLPDPRFLEHLAVLITLHFLGSRSKNLAIRQNDTSSVGGVHISGEQSHFNHSAANPTDVNKVTNLERQLMSITVINKGYFQILHVEVFLEIDVRWNDDFQMSTFVASGRSPDSISSMKKTTYFDCCFWPS